MSNVGSGRIGSLLAEGRTLSVEFFPPKSEEGLAQLERTIEELAAVEVSFASVTYGAGGATRDTTREIVLDLHARRAFPSMPHLTCIGHTRGELEDLLAAYRAAGIVNLLALAGDPPADGTEPSGDFHYATELVELARAAGEFDVGVAAFPEVHPRSADRATDRQHLARKLELADFGITQFFYDVADYLRLIEELDAAGCAKPVVPGIMPITNPTSIRRFAQMNGAAFPEDLAARIDAAEGPDRHQIVVEHAADLCQALLDAGAPGLHFYTLNRSQVTLDVLRAVDFGVVAG